MASNFMAVVYATLKDKNIDTKNMTPQDAVEKFKELNKNENIKQDEKELNNNKNATTNATTFEKQVDDVLNDSYKDSHITISEETPQILQDIGVPNKPILMTAKHTYLAINKDGKYKGAENHYHDLGRDLFLNIPQLLKSPILVFQSDKNKKDIVAVVNAVDKNKNPVIVPLRIKGDAGNSLYIEPNVIKSIYGRKNFQIFLDNYVTKENLLLVENKKIRNIE